MKKNELVSIELDTFAVTFVRRDVMRDKHAKLYSKRFSVSRIYSSTLQMLLNTIREFCLLDKAYMIPLKDSGKIIYGCSEVFIK